MSLTIATPVVFTFARYFSRPACPRCGEEQFAPETSHFVGENLIYHAWSCDDCGHQFHTAVELGHIHA